MWSWRPVPNSGYAIYKAMGEPELVDRKQWS
jgi:hypothetical protein